MKERIFKRLLAKGSEHFFYVGATLIAAFVHFLYAVYVKAYIEPLEFGMYSTCILLKTYFSYVQLGSLNAFNRDYPQLIGAKENEKAKKYRDTTFTYLFFTFLILTIAISGVFIVVGKDRGVDSRYIYGFVFCAIMTTMTTIENFLNSRVRIDGSFRFTSLVIVVELLATALGFYVVPYVGYYSLYIIPICASCIGILMYIKRGMSDITISVDSVLLKSIIISGMPLLINNLIWTVVDSIDKFVILWFMNTERLGVYSIAQMVFSYMVLIPTAMSQLFYVNLGKVYGATSSVEKLNKIMLKYTMVMAVVMSYLVLAAYYYIEPLVVLILPKYTDGVKSAQILMIALAIYTPTMVSGNILTILKKNAAVLRGSVYLCILNALSSVSLVLLLGATIESVALGTAVSYLLRTVILMIQLKKEANTEVGELIKSSIIPVVLISGPGILLYQLVRSIWIGFIAAFIVATAMILILYKDKLKALLHGGNR